MEKTLVNTKNTIACKFYSLVVEGETSDISVSQLMKQCGFSRQTFYRHYLDIYDLIFYIFEQRAVSPKNRSISKRNCDFYINSFDHCLENILSSKKYYSKIVSLPDYNFIEEDLCQYFIECTMRYIGHNNWDSELSIITSIYYSGVAKEISNWIKRGCDKDPHAFSLSIYSAMPERIKVFYESAI